MISIKAYGKILVFGSYSILEPGNTGLVVNVNKGTTTTIKKNDLFELCLPQFGANIYFYFKENELILDMYIDRLSFIRNAIEYSLKYLNYKKIKIKKFVLSSENDKELSEGEIKTGLGSSATSTVSAVAAILKFHNIDDQNIIYKISRYSHYMAQGSGSGFDIAAACFGSHFFVSDNFVPGDFIGYVENAKPKKIKTFKWPSSLIPVLIFTGKSASTKDLVKKIIDFKKRNTKEYSEFMEKYNSINLKAKDAFEKNNPIDIKKYLEESWKMRKKLGELSGAEIETKEISKLISEFKKNGAYTAGLVGAGGGDSIITLFSSNEDYFKFSEFFKLQKILSLKNIKLVELPYTPDFSA